MKWPSALNAGAFDATAARSTDGRGTSSRSGVASADEPPSNPATSTSRSWSMYESIFVISPAIRSRPASSNSRCARPAMRFASSVSIFIGAKCIATLRNAAHALAAQCGHLVEDLALGRETAFLFLREDGFAVDRDDE